MAEEVKVRVEFRQDLSTTYRGPRWLLTLSSGGLEMLFDNKSRQHVSLPRTTQDGARVNVAYLVKFLCDNVMSDSRKELFCLDGTM